MKLSHVLLVGNQGGWNDLWGQTLTSSKGGDTSDSLSFNSVSDSSSTVEVFHTGLIVVFSALVLGQILLALVSGFSVKSEKEGSTWSRLWLAVTLIIKKGKKKKSSLNSVTVCHARTRYVILQVYFLAHGFCELLFLKYFISVSAP